MDRIGGHDRVVSSVLTAPAGAVFFDWELMDRRGAHARFVSFFFPAPGGALILAAFDRRARTPPGHPAPLTHPVHPARREAEQREHKQSPRQGPEPPVDQP